MPFKIITGIIIVLLLLYIFAPTFLPSIFLKIASPFWNIVKPSEEELAQIISSKDYESALVLELRKENEALKEILNRNTDASSTLAYILKKPPFTAYDTFIIDIGLKDNIKVGEKIYAGENILLGEIAEVYDSTSKVRLYSTPGEKYEVTLGVGTSTDNIQVGATGRGGGSFEIVVPRDLKIKEGDTVVIPSLTPNVFGIVKDIVTEDTNTFSTVLFSQPINIYQLKWVELYRQ
jgi:cell shape-determining protein MreC